MNKICRVCLEEGVLSSIFTKNYNLSLSEMIEYCCDVTIRINDGLPEQLCSNCAYKLGIAYHFKQTCKSSDTRLRQYLNLQFPRKQIDAAVMTDHIAPHPIIIKKCKCKNKDIKRSSNYKRKPESEKLRPGPKPKPRQIHACYECNKQFRCQSQLEMHVRTHTGDKPFVCAYCQRGFTQKHNLTIHLRVHSGDQPFQCEFCSKRFSAQSNLYAHLKIHTGEKDHVCSLCTKSFITSSELTRHMNKHRGVKNFKCDLCDAAYVHNRDLKLHKKKKHQVNNTTMCINAEVDKVSSSNKGINHHVPNLINVKPQEDQNLAIEVENPSTMLHYDQKLAKNTYQDVCHQFIKSIHDSHSCAICGETFSYINELAQHYINHQK